MNFVSLLRQLAHAIFQSRVLWTANLLFLAYIALIFVVPYRPEFGEFLNGIRFALALTVIIAYAPIALEALHAPKITKNQQLVLGIEVGWIAWASISVWGLLGRWLDFSVSLTESATTGLFAYLTCLSAILHLTAPSGSSGEFRIRNWSIVTIAIAVGAAIGGAVVATAAWWIASGAPPPPIQQ